MKDDGNLVPGLFDIGTVSGLDTDGNGAVDTYVPSLTTASGLVGLKMDILMSSETKDPVYANNKTYDLGVRTGINDLLNSYYYGRVFSTTVPLRNTAYRNQMANIQ